MTLTTMLLADAVSKGSPDQQRDDHGRFGSGVGGTSGVGHFETARTGTYGARNAASTPQEATEMFDRLQQIADRRDRMKRARKRMLKMMVKIARKGRT